MQGISIRRALLPHAYDPNRLLDLVAQRLGTRNDAALAQRLKFGRTVIAGIRRHAIPVTPSVLLWLHEASGISIAELRGVLGDQRYRMRPGVPPVQARTAMEGDRGRQAGAPLAGLIKVG